MCEETIDSHVHTMQREGREVEGLCEMQVVAAALVQQLGRVRETGGSSLLSVLGTGQAQSDERNEVTHRGSGRSRGGPHTNSSGGSSCVAGLCVLALCSVLCAAVCCVCCVLCVCAVCGGMAQVGGDGSWAYSYLSSATVSSAASSIVIVCPSCRLPGCVRATASYAPFHRSMRDTVPSTAINTSLERWNRPAQSTHCLFVSRCHTAILSHKTTLAPRRPHRLAYTTHGHTYNSSTSRHCVCSLI